MQRSSVDLPEPLNPMMTRNSPSSTLKLTSVSAPRAIIINLGQILDTQYHQHLSNEKRDDTMAAPSCY